MTVRVRFKGYANDTAWFVGNSVIKITSVYKSTSPSDDIGCMHGGRRDGLYGLTVRVLKVRKLLNLSR